MSLRIEEAFTPLDSIQRFETLVGQLASRLPAPYDHFNKLYAAAYDIVKHKLAKKDSSSTQSQKVVARDMRQKTTFETPSGSGDGKPQIRRPSGRVESGCWCVSSIEGHPPWAIVRSIECEFTP